MIFFCKLETGFMQSLSFEQNLWKISPTKYTSNASLSLDEWIDLNVLVGGDKRRKSNGVKEIQHINTLV